MEEEPPQNGGGEGEDADSPGEDASGNQSPNVGDGERKRRRRRSRSGRSGRRGRTESRPDATALSSESPSAQPSSEVVAPEKPVVEPVRARLPKTEQAHGRPSRGGTPRSARSKRARAKAEKPTTDLQAEPARRPAAPLRTLMREGRRVAPAPLGSSAEPEPVTLRAPERPAARRPASTMQLTAEASRAPGRSFWIVVALLTVIGLAVRIPGLGNGLWADEIYSVVYSFRTPFPEALSVFPGDNKHPLYALLAHAALSVFGEGAWVVRLPSLVLGVATIPLLYALGARITSRAEALAAAALLAFSYHHVWFSQNARGYAMLAFFAVLTTLLLLKASRSDGYRLWIWYALAAALGAYTHLTFVFAVVAQFLVVGLATLGWPRGARRIGWRGPLVGFALSAALTVLWYLPMLPQVVAFFLHKESNLKGVSSPGWAAGEALRVLRVGFGDAAGIGVLAIAIGMVVGVAGAVSYARQGLRTFLLLSVPALVTMLGAFTARGTMYPRFFFLLIGFALLIGMRGMFATAAWVSRRLGKSEADGHRLGASVAAVVVLISGLSVPLNWRLPKQDFLGAMAYVERESTASDALAVTDVTAEVYGAFFRKTWRPIRTVSELEAMRSAPRDRSADRGSVWLLYTFPRYLERFDPALSQYVAQACSRDRVRTFPGTVGGGEITVCRLDRT